MILLVVDRLSLRLVPDELWALVEPLVPEFRPRPQGGGTAPVEAHAVFTAIVYVLTSGCAWRDLPPSFGVPFQTAHRRFSTWAKDGSGASANTSPSPACQGTRRSSTTVHEARSPVPQPDEDGDRRHLVNEPHEAGLPCHSTPASSGKDGNEVRIGGAPLLRVASSIRPKASGCTFGDGRDAVNLSPVIVASSSLKTVSLGLK